MSPRDADFASRRAAARQRLNALDPAMHRTDADATGARPEWFEAVYATAGDDPAQVPWADLAPHPLLAAWIAVQGDSLRGIVALDVGCGLGDNAEALAAAGASVTAFDLVETAVAWASRRFPKSPVTYRSADLFDLPPEWRGRFDLVHECYTLQALGPGVAEPARQALTDYLAPGGRLLVIARARADDMPVAGPPWPLARADIEAFRANGLAIESLEAIAPREDMAPHWRAVLRRR